MIQSPAAEVFAWNRRTTFALVTLVAVCAAGLIWLVHPWYEAGGETNDASVYLACTKALLAGQGYTYLGEPFSLRPPGFSVLLLPVLALKGLDFRALNLLVASFGALSVVCLFAYHQRRLGTTLALALAVNIWLNPAFQTFCNRVMSDVPGVALLVAGMLLERWAGKRPSWVRDALLGSFIGLSTYVRTVNLVLAPAIACSRLAAGWSHGGSRGRLRFAVARCTTVLVVPFLVLAPWSVRNALHPPELPIDQTFVHSYSVALLHVDPSDPSSPRVPLPDLFARVARNARDTLQLIGGRMDDGDPEGLRYAIGIVIAAGALIALARRRAVDGFALLGCFASYSISLNVLERYVLPLYLLALPAALDSARRVVARAAGARAASAALAGLLLLVGLLDLRPRQGWSAIREKHQRAIENASVVSAKVPPDVRLAAPVGWHYSVYLDRPVFSLYPALKRTGSLRSIDDTVARYDIQAVIAVPGRPLDAPIRVWALDRCGPGEPAGSFLLWRLRR